MKSDSEQWLNAFWNIVREYDTAQRLRDAAINERLGLWTTELTKVVVDTCRAIGWEASARKNITESLPIQRQEYLALDVMAFAPSKHRWRFPVAVIELENKQADDVIAYSLWKVLCVRNALRIVFCYRRNASQQSRLLNHLCEEVIKPLGFDALGKLEGQTLVVIGSRSDAANFPDGFFKWWSLDKNTGRFNLFR